MRTFSIFKTIFALLLLAASVFLCVRIVGDANLNKQNKTDLAELNDIKYGLLSVDEWKARVTEILQSEIKKLDLASIDQTELRKHIESLLATMIDKVAKNIKKENAGSLEGWVKQSFLDAFVSLEDIKKGIPEYTTTILDRMTSAKASAQFKTAVNEQVTKYSTKIEDTTDRSRRRGIVVATESANPAMARAKLEARVAATSARIARDAWLFMGASVLLFLLIGVSRKPLSPSNYVFLVACLILLLTAGIMTPMIDLEAKISHMSFVLLGHSLQFDNQVLYFQSKSIMDVFGIMMANPDLQMKIVGILMVTFSVVFPAAKLVSSAIYYANWRNARDNAVVRFFVLKSGKWAMADVVVVAMFMAYIGFNGIIDSKLGQLNTAGEGPVLLTTNGTSLQPGYYLFFLFALLALCLTEILPKHPREERMLVAPPSRA